MAHRRCVCLEKCLQIHLLGLFQQEFIPLLHRINFVSIAVYEIWIHDCLKVRVGGVQRVFCKIKVFQELAAGKGFPDGLLRLFFLEKSQAVPPLFCERLPRFSA